MWSESDPDLWLGRVDGDGPELRRWHQVVQRLPAEGDLRGADVVLGFACDEGVRRNQGRVGAAEGPDALRRALANLPRPGERALFDGGTVSCEGDELEDAQQQLSERVADILARSGKPLVLGGGHEMAWGSFCGLDTAIPGVPGGLGIVNIDAHFDLRDPLRGATSGTPFRQIADRYVAAGSAFPYLVVGINPSANPPGIFSLARQRDVQWFEDIECVTTELPRILGALESFVGQRDYLYLSICLDAFPAAVAPGVSAPGVPGICPRTGMSIVRRIRELCESLDTRLLLVDIAEMNPRYDRDSMTARLAARLVSEVLGPGA